MKNACLSFSLPLLNKILKKKVDISRELFSNKIYLQNEVLNKSEKIGLLLSKYEIENSVDLIVYTGSEKNTTLSPKIINEIFDRNLIERKRICEFNRIKCYTFLQPFPRIHVPHKDKIRLSINASDSMKKLYEKFKTNI